MFNPDEEFESAARALAETARRPKRRVRPRLARGFAHGDPAEIETPHGQVTAWRLGAGPATLLVHGWEDDNALWSPLIDAFEHMGRAVIAFDLPGHGWSASDAHTVEAAGEAALAVARALGPVDSVIGHSFGCAVSMYALGHGLEAARAVMIASPVPRTKPYDRFNADWEAEMTDAGEDPEVVRRAAEILKAELADSERSRMISDADIAGLKAKVLILHSMDDDACPFENSERMAELWPGAKLALQDGLGHRLIAQDSAIIAQALDFVEDMEGFGR